MPRDDGLALLIGPDAADLLGAAVGTAGGSLADWFPVEIDHRPGASTTVSYRARIAWPDGEQVETLAASTGMGALDSALIGRPGVLALSDGQRQVAVWRFPMDPGLPALAAAYDPDAMTAMLRSFGVEAGPLRCRVRAYRPRRRAVVEVSGPGVRLFVKVVRPHKVADLHLRHRLLREAGVPVPRSLGWSDDGLLVLEALPGGSLREELRRGSAHAPDGADILDLLDRFPDEVAQLPRRASWSDDVAHYADIVAGAVPAEAARVHDLARRIDTVLERLPAGEEPTHGDLYETQVLLGSDGISGVLDVDTAGPGRRADDLACAIAHLVVLAQMEPDHAETTQALALQWATVFERRVDRAELLYRVAGVVMSLATGPHRVQEPGWPSATRARVDLVEHWVEAATRA